MAKAKIRKGMVGNNVSHSKVRTKRKFKVNVIAKNVTIDGRTQKVKLTTKTLRTIRKHGNDQAKLKNLLD